MKTTLLLLVIRDVYDPVPVGPASWSFMAGRSFALFSSSLVEFHEESFPPHVGEVDTMEVLRHLLLLGFDRVQEGGLLRHELRCRIRGLGVLELRLIHAKAVSLNLHVAHILHVFHAYRLHLLPWYIRLLCRNLSGRSLATRISAAILAQRLGVSIS